MYEDLTSQENETPIQTCTRRTNSANRGNQHVTIGFGGVKRNKKGERGILKTKTMSPETNCSE